MIAKNPSPIRPWYREPWPWLIMAGPAIVVVAASWTAWLAIKSSDGLVEEDYYKQGLAVNQVVARNQHAGDLGLRAEVVRGGDGSLLRVFLHGKPGDTLPAELKLRIKHPTRGGFDQNLVLHADSAGFYSGKLNAPLTGRWHIALEDDKREWRLTGDWNIEKQTTLRMAAAVK